MLKRVSVVTFFTAINLVATFLNQMVLAYVFGAGASMDAFLASGAIPFAILTLAMGDLGFVLVPMLIQYEKSGEEQRVIDLSFTAVSLTAVGLAIVGIAGHRWILEASTAGQLQPRTFELAASIAPTIWVVVGLTVLGSYFTGIHHYRRSFALPAMTLVLPYVAMMTGALCAGARMGIVAVALGWAAGLTIRNLILYVSLPRTKARLCWKLREPVVAKLFQSLFPLGISLLPFAVLPAIDVFWASRLPVGSISYLGYSSRIVIALTAIVVQGISVVLFPDLSEDVANGRFEKFRVMFLGATKAILLVIVPLAVLTIILRVPLLQLILQRGHFTHAATLGVARVLPFYLVGTVWMAVMNIVIRGFYASGNYVTPAKLGLVSVVLYTVLSGLLIRHFSYVGIGMAYAVYWFVSCVLQLRYLEKTVGVLLTPDIFVFLGKVVLSSVLVGFVTMNVLNPLNAIFGQIVSVISAGAGSVILFVVVSHFIFRIPQFKMLLAAVRDR
jgi:putative peptidoglycan lipid II flippase